MLTLLHLLSSVALLVWGTHIVRTGIMRVYGANLRRVLSDSVEKKPLAFVSGIGVTALVQSSNATALLVTSFVAQGLVGLAPALVIMLGADVGTALMARVLTFDLSWLSHDRLVLAGIQHRQVDGFAGLLHQAAQRRMHHRQQVAALQEAAADHKGVRADGPQAEIADLAHESLLLHGGEQAVSSGIRQAGLLGQIGQRHVALGFRNVFQQFQATGQRLYLTGRRTGGGGCCAGLLAALGGSRGGHG